MVDLGFSCFSSPSVCTTSCGDGIVAGVEVCDDSNIDGIGCLADCSGPSFGYSCDMSSPSYCPLLCGNGVDNTGGGYTEQCDDSALTDGDGCSSTC